jgi:hypothetical protein
MLDPADHRCRAEGDEPLLLFANRHDLRLVGLQTGNYQPLIDKLHSAVALDYDFLGNKVYWSDVASERILWTSLGLNDTMRSPQPLVTDDVSTPDGLAVDWVHKNLYWTDTGKNRIEVLALRNHPWRRSLISRGLDEPRAIVVDPRSDQGYMYWTDWGDKAMVGRAFLDGSEQIALINTSLEWPNGLTIDYELNLLFWVDAKLHIICSANLDGSNQRVVLFSYQFIKHPFAITVFEDDVFWSDWETESILRVNKFHATEMGNNSVKNAVIHLHSPMDVHILHKLKQPTSRDVCEDSGCNQLCLPRRNGQFSCMCTDRSAVPYVLGKDGKTCRYFNESEPVSEPMTSKRHYVGATVAATITLFIAALALVSLLVYHWHHRRAIKILNFDNPVYRHTTENHFTAIQQPRTLSSLLKPLTSTEVI